MSALAKALADPWRMSVCSDGFTSIRTGTKNDSPDADLIASVYDDEFAPMLLAAPDLLEATQGSAHALEEAATLLFAKGLAGVAGLMMAQHDRNRAAIAKATGK